MLRSAGVPWLVIILAGAFAVRLAAAVAVQHYVEGTPGRLCLIAGDAEGYWELGNRLARGEEYSLYEPPRRVLRMPGFPLLLAAGIQMFGDRLLWIRMLLAATGTAACGMVYWLGAELFDRRTGLTACLLAAICPTFVIFSVMLLSETLFAGCLVASLAGLSQLVRLRQVDGPRGRQWGTALISGIAIGVATLVRPTWLLAGPGFAAIYLATAREIRTSIVPAALVLAGLGLMLLPWTVRNAFATGHFVPTTLWVGASLYDGLNPAATGASDMRFVETDGIYERLTEYEADRHYRRAALEYARRHPARSIELAASKLWRFWNPLPNADQFGSPWLALPVAGCSIVVLALAACGAWQARRALWLWLIPAAPVLYFSLVHVVFVGSVRYRLPAEYALLVLSAVGWIWLTGGGASPVRVRESSGTG